VHIAGGKGDQWHPGPTAAAAAAAAAVCLAFALVSHGMYSPCHSHRLEKTTLGFIITTDPCVL
jgi:hypothetical protein